MYTQLFVLFGLYAMAGVALFLVVKNGDEHFMKKRK